MYYEAGIATGTALFAMVLWRKRRGVAKVVRHVIEWVWHEMPTIIGKFKTVFRGKKAEILKFVPPDDPEYVIEEDDSGEQPRMSA